MTVMPALPNRLTTIDETNRGAYSRLMDDDVCYFFGEYFAGKSFSGGETNNLISNFKIEPTKILASPYRAKYKNQAISTIAAALRAAISPNDVNTRCTFVPIPPSKAPGHPDYCDRIERTLRKAFVGLNADIRPLVRQTRSLEADHRAAANRVSFEELLAVTAVDGAHLAPAPRGLILLVDDVLTTGKHFKVCKQRILEALPHANIRGLFVARCIHQDASADFGALLPS
jgi:predicted amidophosphoribosyltransferase